jgi:hypothetical protein
VLWAQLAEAELPLRDPAAVESLRMGLFERAVRANAPHARYWVYAAAPPSVRGGDRCTRFVRRAGISCRMGWTTRAAAASSRNRPARG